MGHSLTAICFAFIVLVIGVDCQTCASLPDTTCSACYVDNIAIRDPKNAVSNQYFVIGGLFDLHQRGTNAYTCDSTMTTNGIIDLLAFFWAIDKYKAVINSPVSVGAVAFDSCSRSEQTIGNVLSFAQCNIRVQEMQQENLVAYVGPYDNDDTIRTGMLASDLGITLLSPTANSLDLSFDDEKTLLRLRPSFMYDIEAVVGFLRHMNSKFAMILYLADDPFWASAYMKLKEKLEGSNICVQFSQSIDDVTDMDTFVDTQLKPRLKAKYVVPLMSRAKLDILLGTIANGNNDAVNGELRFILTSEIGRNIIFLTSKSSAAANAIVIDSVQPATYDPVMSEFKTYINNGAVDSLSDVDNQWITHYEETVGEIPKIDDNTPSPIVMSALRTIMSVELVMKGMDKAMQDCNQQNFSNYQFCDKLRNEKYKQNDLYRSIKSALPIFESASGELRPNQAQYEYYIFANRQGRSPAFEKIGSFSNGNTVITVDLENDFGSGFNPSECPNAGECCEPPTTMAPPTSPPTVGATSEPTSEEPPKYSTVQYRLGQAITGAYPAADHESYREEYGTRFDQGHRWVIALGVLAGVGILAVIIFEIYILYKLLGTRMGHKWRTMWLGQLLLFGIFLAYLVLFAYIFVPTKATCGITRFGVGVSYAICFAVLLVKLMVILTSKSSDVLLPGDESPNYLKGIYQFLMFVFAVGVQIVIDVQWLITVPPEAVQVTANDGSRVWVCNHYTWEADKGMDSMADFVRTNFENHLMSLIYIMLMILITTILSLNAHGIITNHRESVFIGIAAGFSIPIWLAWGLVGGLNKDQDYAQEYGDACIAFGLFLTATLILFAMFLPKVRQLVNMGVEGIYLEDDRDTYYAGSVIMAPPSYKSKGASSVIYVNNQGIYSEPVVVGNGDPMATHLKHPMSTYSAPPTYLKKAESAYGSTRVLRVTDDLKGRHPQKRPQSEVAFGSSGRPRSAKGTLRRSRSQTSLGAL
ncbi:metabotropic glutamate receptor 2 isoform X2 [Aplysia californica]|uniref:Metabotropic glutamate receptor 2 isoform X2 n=1 Tax=Aplysia californica TaxID=6500 RepID=A0ABM0JAR4_APLCA|nr:metabotropic glutamate receptor 2 isoform X2 [Aplysia californica]